MSASFVREALELFNDDLDDESKQCSCLPKIETITVDYISTQQLRQQRCVKCGLRTRPRTDSDPQRVFKKVFFGYMDCRVSLFPENLRTRTDVDPGDECRSIFSYICNDILGIIINFS